MKVNAITLMEAYIIENLRKIDVTDEELIEINDESIKEWEKRNDNFDYHDLKKLAEENQTDYQSIVKDGYKVKFLTLNGLVNLIGLKFNKKRDTDFTVHENGIASLKIAPTELLKVRQMLSANWNLIETDEGISIRSKH